MAEEYEKVLPPQGYVPQINTPTASIVEIKNPSDTDFGTFPPTSDDQARISQYQFFYNLFKGDHFTAFNVKVQDEDYNKEYAKLRFVKANFAGLISKICADFLFSEPIKIKFTNGKDEDQQFIDQLVEENFLNARFYESALSNSYYGDALFKIRIGQRTPNGKSTIIIENVPPALYFPIIDPFNVNGQPLAQVLAWLFKDGDKTYLREEIHTIGQIENRVWEMKGNKKIANVSVTKCEELGIQQFEYTKIDRSLLIHIPNWSIVESAFGVSDYYDLDSLFFAIDNRLSKNDNILDKHGDPILAVPQGILDEKGSVRKKALGVVEMGEGDDGKPEYIVWDASLDASFKQIEKLIEMIYLISEVSPDAFGMGKGTSDSGRALKYKLLRTIAKIARKKIYYDRQIKELIYVCELLAQKWGLEVGGVKFTGTPDYPEIVWGDGLPEDTVELIDNETKMLDAGIQSKKQSIIKIHKMDDEAATELLEEIEGEQPRIEMPKTNIGDMSDGKQNIPPTVN